MRIGAIVGAAFVNKVRNHNCSERRAWQNVFKCGRESRCSNSRGDHYFSVVRHQLCVNGGDGNDVHGDRVIVTAGKYKDRTGAMRGFTSSGKSAYVRSRARREGEVLTVDVPDVDKEQSFGTGDGAKKLQLWRKQRQWSCPWGQNSRYGW